MPGCGARSRAVRGSPADRTSGREKKFLLRDHAPAQLLGSQRPGARTWLADGAPSRPGRAGLWRRRPGDVWPAAAPPASGGPAAGIPGPGSSAGSNAAAGTCARTLCAGRSAGAVGALWRRRRCLSLTVTGAHGRFDLPRESSGRMRQHSPRALSKREQDACLPVYRLLENKTER